MNVNADYKTALATYYGKRLFSCLSSLEIFVFADPIFFEDGDGMTTDVYELFTEVNLRLNGLPFEFKLRTAIYNPVEMSEMLFSLFQRAKNSADYRGCFEADPLAGLYLLQEFLSLPVDARFIFTKVAMCVETGKTYHLDAVLPRVNILIADIEARKSVFDDDALFWVDDAIRYPAGMPTIDPFDWMHA